MPSDPSYSLVNLGNLSKPATTFVKKMSKAVGGPFEPWHIRRVAKAKEDAALIKTKGRIQRMDLEQRAMHRRIEEDERHQQNMESIVGKAIPQLDDNASPNDMDDDWIANFFDKCRIVSDGDMQTLWSKVLAGEAGKPGTYSKRTVNFLSEMDKNEAMLFTKLCGFFWQIGDIYPLIFDHQEKIYNNNNINFDTIRHLESIGLVTYNEITTISRIGLPKKFTIAFYGKPLALQMLKDSDNDLDIGHVLFTHIGRELAPICGSKPVAGFYEYVKEHWKQYLPESQP